jgi:hypothetical protein
MPPKSLKAIATNFRALPVRIHRRDGPIVLGMLICVGFGRGSERGGLGVTCATSREGRGEVLGGHRGNDGEIDTTLSCSSPVS